MKKKPNKTNKLWNPGKLVSLEVQLKYTGYSLWKTARDFLMTCTPGLIWNN